MDVVVLSAGFGTRLMPITEKMQKVSLGVYSMPPLLYQLHNLRKKGFKNFYINVFHNKETVIRMLNDFSIEDINIHISEESVILGTGGALIRLKDCLSENFLVINGDSYLDIDILPFYSLHISSRGLATLMLGERKSNAVSGINIDGIDNAILDIDVKKQHNYPFMFYGCHILNKSIFDHYDQNTYMDIVLDVYMHMIKERSIKGFITDRALFDIGTMKNIMSGLALLVRSKFSIINLKDYCDYDEDSNTLYFKGCPAYSDNVMDSTVSYNVTVSKGSRIINSVIMQNNYIPKGLFIEGQIIPPFTYC